MKKTYIIITLIVLLAISLMASDGSGGQAGAFLRIPMDVHAKAMGNAYTALGNDVSGLYFNPGAIYQISNKAISANYSSMSMDRSLMNIGVVSANRTGQWGFMVSRMAVDDIVGRDTDGTLTGDNFSNQEYAVSATYGLPLAKFIGLGGSAKLLYHSIYNSTAIGYAFDGGIHAKIKINAATLSLGASAINLAGTKTWDDEIKLEEEIPYTISGGMAFQNILGERVRYTICGDYVSTEGEDGYIRFGSEIALFDHVAFQLGYANKLISGGASFMIYNTRLCYAINQDFLDSGLSHSLGLSYSY